MKDTKGDKIQNSMFWGEKVTMEAVLYTFITQPSSVAQPQTSSFVVQPPPISVWKSQTSSAVAWSRMSSGFLYDNSPALTAICI